jgi:Ulp1 family protease
VLHDDAVPLARETVRDEGVITDERVTKGGPRRQLRQRLVDYVATRSRPKVSAIQLTTRYGLNGQDMMRLFQKQFLNDPVLKVLSKATNASSLHDKRAMRASACLRCCDKRGAELQWCLEAGW